MKIIRLLLFVFTVSGCNERITSFVSTITLKTDGTVVVQEQIDILSENQQIIHGIVREFPTKYHDKWGVTCNVGFNIISVTCDGENAPFTIKSAKNGHKIYIGDNNRKISTGAHSYVITYETTRQLGFFEDHDELYWNVTGNGWRLPIDKVRVYVQLPAGIAPQLIKAEAYTGYQGDRGTNYVYSIKDNRVAFFTKSGLWRREGLTIVVTFPKGFIIEPSLFQKAWWFFKDNFLLVILIIGLFLTFMLFIVGVKIVQQTNRPGTIIPLFYPPQGMTPADIGFINNRKFDSVLLSADIINLAVRGFIVINYTPGKVWGGTYTLSLKEKLSIFKTQKEMNTYEAALLMSLFSEKENIILTQNTPQMREAFKECKEYTHKKCNSFVSVLNTFLQPILFINVGLIAMNFLLDVSSYLLVFQFFYFIFIATPFFQNLFRIYTPSGRKIQDAIEGFKMYLMAAEVNRMQIIGTPPTKTPELYETYLPYAIALGVEQEWTHQFSFLFKYLEMEGKTYHPSWYRGRRFRAEEFGSELNKSFSNTVSSAANPPGRYSGSGGRGSSGGGGGGGGGGGW